MTKLRVNYRSVLRVETPAGVESGRAIEVRRESRSTGDAAGATTEKLIRTILKVNGTVGDKDKGYPLTWEFPWPEANVEDLDYAIRELRNYETSHFTPTVAETEVSLDVYAWLQVGIIDKHKERSGYVEFTKGGVKLRVRLHELNEFRNAISKCLNP
jgi:hypothetical protein